MSENATATLIARRLLRVEADLQAQSALLHTVLDESPDFIVLKDWQDNFLLASKPVADFYGTTPEAMVGRRDNDFGVPDDMAAQMLQNVLRRPGGQPRHRRLTPTHPARRVTEYRIDRTGAIHHPVRRRTRR